MQLAWEVDFIELRYRELIELLVDDPEVEPLARRSVVPVIRNAKIFLLGHSLRSRSIPWQSGPDGGAKLIGRRSGPTLRNARHQVRARASWKLIGLSVIGVYPMCKSPMSTAKYPSSRGLPWVT
jgi:hypothetical protein